MPAVCLGFVKGTSLGVAVQRQRGKWRCDAVVCVVAVGDKRVAWTCARQRRHRSHGAAGITAHFMADGAGCLPQQVGDVAQTVSLHGHLHDAGTFFWAKLMVVGSATPYSGCCTWCWRPSPLLRVLKLYLWLRKRFEAVITITATLDSFLHPIHMSNRLASITVFTLIN